MSVHNSPTIRVSIRVPLHNVFAFLEDEISVNETVIVRECCPSRAFAIRAVAVDGAFVSSGYSNADSAAVAGRSFDDFGLAGHGCVVGVIDLCYSCLIVTIDVELILLLNGSHLRAITPSVDRGLE
jgi:hypothetical protein